MSMDELDPHVARALTLAARFQSALDGTLNQMNNGSFRATDEAETVEVRSMGTSGSPACASKMVC
ncbi:ESX-1 secretion-associated protein EspL [Mycobacterium tuberculosis]|nr:ESX-1 secretion-associated protein EspL [Mycobacterium tuberculosis]